MPEMLTATNPTTGTVLASYPALDENGIHQAIASAHQASAAWQATSFKERSALLGCVAASLRRHKTRIAQIMAAEMGKPVREGEAEVEKSAVCAEHYADNAAAYLADETLASDARHSYVTCQPLGTLLGILPWNAPLWLAFRFLAPALMAGNTCVMKHDPHVPASAQAIMDVFNEAMADTTIPANIVVNLPITTASVLIAINDPRIAAVSFIGSSSAGRKVAAAAAAQLKPAVLELGGSDPLIVMADANLDKAADIAVLSRIINAGQSCIAAKRIIVEAPIYDTFVERLRTRLQALRMGDPCQPDIDLGPLARDDLRQNLHRQVTATLNAGGKCLLGGDLPSGPGYFYPPTLLVDITPAMCAFKEETFGPVMVVCKADSFDEALALANTTEYGLGASIWTADTDKARLAIQTLQAGQVAVNGIVKTDPRLPSGGIKGSGYGRELGPHGIHEFVNHKQVWVG